MAGLKGIGKVPFLNSTQQSRKILNFQGRLDSIRLKTGWAWLLDQVLATLSDRQAGNAGRPCFFQV